MIPVNRLDATIAFLRQYEQDFLRDLAEWTGMDCGTDDKAGVDRAGEWLRRRCDAWGWPAIRYPLEQYGDCWQTQRSGAGRRRIMLLGHLDTVYPAGTVAVRTMHVDGNIITGPGVSDMKGGLLVGLYALRALEQIGFTDFAELTMFFNSDEEVGSSASRAHYLPIVRTMDVALVLESARANGDIVSGRKGGGHYAIRVKGRAAHAGVEPEKGASATAELAYQILAAHGLNGMRPGVTVNVGVVEGGSRLNVVPDSAVAQLDVRAVDAEGAAAVDAALRAQVEQVHIPGTQAILEGEFGTPPMPRTPAIARLVTMAQDVAAQLGFSLRDTVTGGTSDANFCAAAGVPVLDGLGPIGGLDHSPGEYIERDSIIPRTALLAGLLMAICQNEL